MTDRPATIVLADADVLFRSTLRDAMQLEPDLRVVAESSDEDAALEAATRLQPDLLIVADTLVRTGDGLQVSGRLRDVGSPPPYVLILLDQQDGEGILNALECGAVGTVSRHDRLSEFLHSTRAAVRGEACVPRRMLGGVLGELIHRRRLDDAVARRYERLSRREREVLDLLARGQEHTSIASELVISPQTVRSHIQSILHKLEVHSRLEAANLAAEHGLGNTNGRIGAR